MIPYSTMAENIAIEIKSPEHNRTLVGTAFS
jgi:hypothetical protein